MNPAATAAARTKRTCSPSTIQAKGTTIKGVAKVKAVASASGSSDRATKLANMPPEPASERPTWPKSRLVRKAVGNSPRQASQADNATSAKIDRKKTTSETGKTGAAALISAHITLKTRVAPIFSPIPFIIDAAY
jgi:hypothetical protein